ncbi:MAG: hypothetical protein NTZ96_06480 [Burkholderiales bacterium]|nr:hypothetical protein [Burkholderiales bacterium]
MLPSYDLWKQSTSMASIGSGSREWQALDKAYKDFSESQNDQNMRKHLENMLDAFDEAKKKKYASINNALTPGEAEKKSDRDQLGAITALRRYLKNWTKEYTAEDLVGLREVKLAQSQALRRTLSDAKVRYKSDRIKVGKELGAAAYAAYSSLKGLATELKPNASDLNPAGWQGDAATVSTEWQNMLRSITGMEGDLQQEVMQALSREIGEKVLADVSGYIPVLGVVKDGFSVFMSMKGIVDNELKIYRNEKARPLTRKGDIQAAITSLQSIFEKQRVSLGIDLAGSVSALVTGAVSSGMAGPITNAAVSVAKLIYTIRNFVADHIMMTRANKILGMMDTSDNQLLEIMEKFPFIGAHLIATIETSTLIEICGYEINDPFYQLTVRSYNNQLTSLRESARDIILNSRFEIVITNDRESEATRKALNIASRRAKDLSTQRTRELVDERQRELAAQKAKILAEQQARDLADHQKKMAAFAALQEKNLAKLRVLQKNVKQALATYRDQTTGFKSMITRQSKESTDAIAELTSLTSSTSVQDLSKLQTTVEYLLKKPITDGASVNRLLAPLKQPSRLYDLLHPAYLAMR